MHHVGFVDTEDMNVTSGKRKFSSLVGYSSSKLAEVHSTLHLNVFWQYVGLQFTNKFFI